MTTRHTHADLLMIIAEGKEVIQWQDSVGKWFDQAYSTTLREIADGTYSTGRYRRKPKTIRIGEFDVPEPMREAPERGTKFWTPRIDPWNPTITDEWSWTDHEGDRTRMNSGVAHLTQDAARLHRKALLSLTQKT